MGFPCEEILGNHSKGLPGRFYTLWADSSLKRLAEVGQERSFVDIYETRCDSFSQFAHRQKWPNQDSIYLSFFEKLKEHQMNKAELIEAIAAAVDLPKATAARTLDAMTSTITSALKVGDSVSLVGFGTFAVKARAAREGRNPQTGATLKIAAANLPSFKAGKTLKDAVN